MKRRVINGLACSIGAYLRARNNDIHGYWGIGVLCEFSKRKWRPNLSFKIYPSEVIRICGYEVTNSKVMTDKLIRFELSAIEGRLSFFKNGRYPHGAEKYLCGIAIAVTQSGRTGLGINYVECWPHDESRERRSNRFT